MLELRTGQIDLWFCFSEPIRDEDLLAAYRTLLTDDELKRLERFYFEKDRHRHLLTHALVRTVLSRYAATRPANWRFVASAHGKPAIANDDATARNISFNISHTDGLVMLGVTSQKALGVDTENLRTRRAPIEIAASYFFPNEVQALSDQPDEQQHERFFQYWTLKESYIKARGMGLSIPLDQFSFHFQPDGSAVLATEPSLQDEADRWHFWQLRPTADYLATVCTVRDIRTSDLLVSRRIVPMVGDEPFECRLVGSR